MTANNNLTTNFNVDPYYDDFDENKNFHRILYRPGFAVQARELTQQQSILQNQVHRVGNHIFRDGSEVSGTTEVLDQTAVFRLKSTYAGSAINVSTFDGNYARTRTSEQLFKVKKVVAAAGGDFNLIFAQYVQNANTSDRLGAVTPIISNGEIIDFSSSFINGNNIFSANTGAAQILLTGDTTVAKEPVTRGFLYSVDESIYYHKGLFIKAPAQTIAIAANTAHKLSIGFTSTESLINSDIDSTLTDPARGSYNYAAPGADRLKVELTLTTKPVADIASPPVSSNNYFEIARILDGTFTRKRPATDYNVLGDEFARRTFEESGHYTVEGLTLTFANTSATTSNLVAQFSPGTAYVKGYRCRTPGVVSVDVPKARTTDTVTEQSITGYYGNYLVANTLATGLISTDDRVELHSNLTPSATTKVGEAHIRNIEYLSGSSDQRKYKLFLYDIRITATDKNFNHVKSIIKGTHSSISASIQVNTDSITSFEKTGDLTSGSATIQLTSAAGVQVGQAVENNGFPANTFVSSITFDSATLTNSATVSNTSSTITFRSVKLTDKDFNRSYFVMPHTNVANTVNIDYKFKRKFAAASFTSGSATIQTNGGSERFSSGTGDLAHENFIVVVKSGGTGTSPTGSNLDMTAGSRSITAPTPTPGNPASATINLNDGSFNGTCDIVASIDVTNDTRRVKTRTNATKTFAGGYPASSTKLSLGYADSIKINAIYEGNSSLVTSNTSQLVRVHGSNTTMQDVTNKFIFDTGQRDSFYDHGTVSLKPGFSANTNQILVDFSYYAHGGGLGFFSESSYPDYTTIPRYRNSQGEEVHLRDVLDFRPSRSSNTSSNTYITTKAFENHQIVDSQTFNIEADYSYYKKVVHTISLDENKNFIVTTGAADIKSPQVPLVSSDQMVLATLRMNPYTYDEQDLVTEVVDNRRYTMRDIGALESRIENLEYYTSLNLLESQVASTQFLDDEGEARYKNGFIVDPFTGHSVGDVFNNDYKAAIDREQQVMRARFSSDSTPLVADAGATLSINNKLVTLPFTQALYASQTEASGTINVNPFQVVTYRGNIELDPDKDIWIDNISTPTIVTNFQGQLDHFKYLKTQVGSTTEYGNWRNIFKGKKRYDGAAYSDGSFVQGGQSGYVKTDARNITTTATSLQLTNSIHYEYMRVRKVNFEVTNLRPNTRLYLFMGGVDISDHAAPSSFTSTRVEQVLYATGTTSRALITDANGSLSGYFWIPNGDRTLNLTAYLADPNALPALDKSNTVINGRKMPVGTADVMLVDNFIYPTFAFTSASATFTAAGTQNKYKLVSSSSTVTQTNTERGDFLSSDASLEEVRARTPGYDESSNHNSLATFIAARYRDDININRAPEEAGFKHWFQRFLEGKYTGDVAPVSSDFNPGSAARNALQAQMSDSGKINGQINNPLGTCPWGQDPLAQTFLIPNDFYPHGVFLTSVDIFMATKDLNNLPLRIELRPTVNGFPSAEEAVRGSSVTMLPSQITANPTTPTATNVAFKSPIYLEPGEYSVVLLSDSLEYFTYIGTIGDDKLNGTGKITSQPTLGSLFKSQNARTWTPQQESDLCFNLYQANFTKDTSFTITMSSNNVGRVAYSANTSTANTVGQYDLANIVMPKQDSLAPVAATYQLRTKNLGGSVQPFVNVLPNRDIVFESSKEVSTNSDLQLKVVFRTSDINVSPSFKLGSSGITLIKNIINAPPTGTFVAETSANDGYALSKYITRKVTLGDTLSAKNLKVFVDQNMPKGATVEAYYRVINNEDDTNFEERPYVLMTRRQTAIDVNEDPSRFNEYEYFADNITYTQAGALYDKFDAFSIKIVMYADSTAAAPSFRNFRAIALA